MGLLKKISLTVVLLFTISSANAFAESTPQVNTNAFESTHVSKAKNTKRAIIPFFLMRQLSSILHVEVKELRRALLQGQTVKDMVIQKGLNPDDVRAELSSQLNKKFHLDKRPKMKATILKELDRLM